MTLNEFIAILNNPINQAIFIFLIAWSLAWKGIALWKSARSQQKGWFIAMLILNTFGILEIVYLFYFSRPKTQRSHDSH